MDIVQIKDKRFGLTISEKEILNAIESVAQRINADLQDKNPLFICVLNGAFMFAADLMKFVTIPSEVTFVKLSSYEGLMSTGKVKEVFGLTENLSGRTVVIVEDIIDSGRTLSYLIEILKQRNPNSIRLCTLLDKPERRVRDVRVDYCCFNIPDEFVVGYGLDYAQKYRNLPFIGVVELGED